MQTYGNLAAGYRPHLDSQDFVKALRLGVLVALLLSMAFSVRGNYLGLEQTLEKNWLWLTCISAGITLTSAFLAMLTVIRVPGLSRGGRILAGIAALGLFYISTRLTLIGFSAGEQERQENLLQEHPDVVKARQDLDAIIKRQRQYGVSEGEKTSLMAREREQRAWLRETETRVRMEMGDQVQSRAARALSDEAQIARQLFAVAPDLSIMVLSPVLVLLWGAAGVAASPGPSEPPERQVVYVPVPTAGSAESRAVTPPPMPEPPAPGVNGRMPQKTPQPAWNPFAEGGEPG